VSSKAVHNVNNVIADELMGMDVTDQAGIDKKNDRSRRYQKQKVTLVPMQFWEYRLQ